MSAGAGTRPPLSLVVPASVVVALLQLPLVYLAIRALGSGEAWEILWRERTFELMVSTGVLVLGVTAAAVALGVTLAWLVARTDLPGRRIWGVAAALPLVIPSYVAALALLGAFGPRGLAQQALGVEELPDIRGYWGALLALTLTTYPYVYLLCASALRNQDPALEDAARGLGRSPWRSFFSVTLPMLRPTIGVAAILVALYVLSDFGVVSLMNYDALTRAIFLHYRALFDRTPAAVLALLLVVLTVFVLLIEAWTRRRVRYHRSSPGPARLPRTVPLGAWRYPALAFCAVTVGLFLALPAGVLGYWLAEGIANERDLTFPWAETVDSLSASALAAGVAAAAALPVAVLAARYRSPRTRALERLGYSGNALPGIVIALSLVFFAARYASPVYQTLALLVFAYVVRFFPQALSGSSSALETISPRLEEAARGLGRGPLRTLKAVTVPLARSGVLAGAALVFLSAMKELPATLLLRPIGFDTLATEIWTLTTVGAYSRAALPALVLIAVSAPVLYVLSADRRPQQSS
ncbi:MAG TPA: iron ABC transporter permease [Gaiellaceae bacterium]|nr:iron ABC transporter permease [Gaiellaceae bacterium]